MRDYYYLNFTITIENVSGIYVYYIKGFPKKTLREYDDDEDALQAAKKYIDKIIELYQSHEQEFNL